MPNALLNYDYAVGESFFSDDSPLCVQVTDIGLAEPIEYAERVSRYIQDNSSVKEGDLIFRFPVEKDTPIFQDPRFREMASHLLKRMPEWLYYFEIKSKALGVLTLGVLPDVHISPGKTPASWSVSVKMETVLDFLIKCGDDSRLLIKSEQAWQLKMREVLRYFGFSSASNPTSFPLVRRHESSTPQELMAAKLQWLSIAKDCRLSSFEIKSASWHLLDDIWHIVFLKDSGELRIIFFEDHTGNLDMHAGSGWYSCKAEAEWVAKDV